EREPRRELNGAKGPQAVVAERRRIDDTQYAAKDISPTVEGIEVLLGQRIPQNRVDREVAASCGVLDGHPRIARDLEPAMAAARLRLAARERHVDIARLEHLKALADGLDAAQRLEQRLHAIGRNTEDLDVDVFDGQAHQSIAHPAADDECATTGG